MTHYKYFCYVKLKINCELYYYVSVLWGLNLKIDAMTGNVEMKIYISINCIKYKDFV